MGYAHLVEPGHKIKLKDFDPSDSATLEREEAEEKTSKLLEELVKIQELVYAAGKNAVLVVLQGPDTSGKDGAIRHVMGLLNAQGCDVVSFKVPTVKELKHDFLWRIHAEAPSLGDIRIFNRSHYEDVLVVRVHKLVP